MSNWYHPDMCRECGRKIVDYEVDNYSAIETSGSAPHKGRECESGTTQWDYEGPEDNTPDTSDLEGPDCNGNYEHLVVPC